MNVKHKLDNETEKRFSKKILDRELNYLERELDHLKKIASARCLTTWELNRVMIIRECFEFIESS